MTIDYQDQVLSPLVTPEREALATADVDALAAFPIAWRERLIMLRTYILVCLDFASTEDDPFTLKLGQYRTEFDEALVNAKAAASAATATAAASLFSIPLERA
jgi:hypothetical protein